MNRQDSKYYPEMQQLALDLVKYLNMNDDPNEHNYQGNHNLTYLIENMTEEDFKNITNMFLRRIPMGEVREMIQTNWLGDSARIVLEENKKEDINMKLWLVTLQGMNHEITGSAPHGQAYVLANNPSEAANKLMNYVNERDLGFRKERELKSVELIADDVLYPDCGMRLFL